MEKHYSHRAVLFKSVLCFCIRTLSTENQEYVELCPHFHLVLMAWCLDTSAALHDDLPFTMVWSGIRKCTMNSSGFVETIGGKI